jgi:hypothetical protein
MATASAGSWFALFRSLERVPPRVESEEWWLLQARRNPRRRSPDIRYSR